MSRDWGIGLGSCAVIVTCEHGGNLVPQEYQGLFEGAELVLESHRGWDIGALVVAERLAERLGARLFSSRVSRLLVELNRSEGHDGLFSVYTSGLDRAEQERILERFYRPYRADVLSAVEGAVLGGMRVLHMSVHSFVDVLDGRRREIDVGLLFDPSRAWEVGVCEVLSESATRLEPRFRLAFNEPYKGIDDGHTTSLRSVYSDDWYAGIELEIRQGLIGLESDGRAVGELFAAAIESL